LILETNTGFCCSPEIIEDISKVIYSSYCLWTGESEELKIDWDGVKNYNREKISSDLSNIVENL
jgi:hypothetical protein